MGRAKLNMELISKEKSRTITFKKRKEGLVRKMHEFTSLCDVIACMIIYGPKQDKVPVEPEIWPQNPDEVKRIVEIYKSRGKDSSNKTFSLSDFFHDRKRKAENELVKLRRKNMEARYPTWHEFMNLLTESQLREFGYALNTKNEYVKSRLEFLKRVKESNVDMNLIEIGHARVNPSQSHNNFYSPGLISSVKPFEMQVPLHYPTGLDHHQELHHNSSMMMLMMNENDHYLRFGGVTTSGNVQRASYKTQVIYESTTGRGIVDPMLCPSPKPLARYYAQPVLSPVHVAPGPPYVVVPGMVGPQLQFTTVSKENHFDQEDNVAYQMKNCRTTR